MTSKAGAVVTAAATTDVTVTESAVVNADASVNVNGGKDVTVNVTDTDAGDGDTITLATAAGAEILVGGATAAVGKVAVTNTATVAGNQNQADVFVRGGTEVTVTENVTGTTVATTTTQGEVFVVGNANTTTVSVTQDALVAASATKKGIANGDVEIYDANATSNTAAGTIATVSLNNFAVAVVNSGALTTLNLMGTGTSVNAGALGQLTTAANDTLAVNVNGLTLAGGALTIDTDIKTLNIASSTAASSVAQLVNNSLTTLNVSGDAKFSTTNNAVNLTALTAINVTNTAGVSLAATLSNSTTFTGGDGADSIVIGATTKAIVMGKGDDAVQTSSVTLAAGGSVDGGDGTDTVSMVLADAVTASASGTFNSKFSNFEELKVISGAAGTVNLVGVNGVSLVETSGATGAQTFNNMASGGTLTLSGAIAGGGSYVVGVTNAAFSTTDTLNISLENSTAGVVAFGSVTAADVETVAVSTVDKGTAANVAATLDTATLVFTDAKTVTVSGNNGLTILNTAGSNITSFDASGVVGDDSTDTTANLAVTFSSGNATTTAVVTIKGGAGNDTLTGNAAKDTIDGGAGNDIIDGGLGQDTITVGAGRDVVNIANNDDNTAGDIIGSGTAAADKISGFTLTDAALAAVNLGATGATFQAATGGGANASLLSLDATADDAAGTAGANQALAVEANSTGAGSASGVTYEVKDGILTLGGAGVGTVDTLGEWLVEATAVASTLGEVLAFEFAGDTYVYAENGTADILVELDGLTGAKSLVEISGATTAAAGSILYADIV